MRSPRMAARKMRKTHEPRKPSRGGPRPRTDGGQSGSSMESSPGRLRESLQQALTFLECMKFTMAYDRERQQEPAAKMESTAFSADVIEQCFREAIALLDAYAEQSQVAPARR